MKSNCLLEKRLWWPFPKQTEQAKFNVVLTTDNLFLHEILYGLLHVLASLAIFKSPKLYYLLLLLDLKCGFLNFKFKKQSKQFMVIRLG
jgi:hypothetical protein